MQASKAENPTRSNLPVFKSEGALFCYKLGEQWQHLHPDIQRRFEKDPTPDAPLHYQGVMTRMFASPLGLIAANLTRFIGCLQPFTEAPLPVRIQVYGKPGETDLYKFRQYLRRGRKPFLFTSRMRLGKQEEILELVGRGFGMVLSLSVTPDGNLHFFSDRYFLRAAGRLWRIPLWLTPGVTNLTHFNIDQDNFHIRIDIRHPLFGQMFLHEGRFWEKGTEPPDDYRDIDFTVRPGSDRRL